MEISLTHALLMSCLAILIWQSRAFLRSLREWDAKEEAWRTRERELVDRLLVRAGVKPLLEREHVVTLPDPEVRQPNWIEDAFKADMIMEEAEYIVGKEAIGKNVEWLRANYPVAYVEAEAAVDAKYGVLKG